MLRFSVRDVLWLTVVVGLSVGWGLHAPVTVAIYQSQEHLHSFQVSRLQDDVAYLKQRLLACELEAAAAKEKSQAP